MSTKPMKPIVFAFAIVWTLTFSANAQDDDVTNRLSNRISVSARFGFNLSARFSSLKAPVLQSQRTTPSGGKYNYDDGYLLRDASGNAGGKTWYLGYDDSSAQVSGNNILLNRNTASVSGSTVDDNPSFGGEVVYTRMLGHLDRFTYGFEVAGNFLNMSLNESSTQPTRLDHTTDAYPFTSGTTPPSATPSAPYQGRFEGPGFVVGDKPVTSNTPVPGGATSTASRRFDADVWGFRLGPYLEFPVSEKFTLSLSGGLAGALIDADVSWSEQIASPSMSLVTLRGAGKDTGFLWGYYLAANVAWELSPRWSIVGSAQFQSLENYSHNFGGRTVEAKLDQALFVTIGLGYKF